MVLSKKMWKNTPIYFVPKVKKLHGDGVEVDMADFINIKFFVDSKSLESRFFKEFAIF
jgi:hypothetical protein